MMLSPEVVKRQAIEKRIARAFVKDALAAGYLVSVDNGEDETKPLAKVAEVIKAMFLTDEEHLYVWKDGNRKGWAYFIYGNDGWDVISDYTTNIEPLMATADAISNKIQGKL